jgi:hypothetical protein
VYPDRHVRYQAFTRHTSGSRYFHSFIRPALATRSGAAPRIGIYSPSVGNTLGGCASHWYLFAQRWQYAQRLRLALEFLYSPDIGNTLRGCAFQPDASNTLGGYAYLLTLAFTFLYPVLATCLGAAPYAVNLNSLQHCQLHFVCYVDFGPRNLTPFGSTPMTL